MPGLAESLERAMAVARRCAAVGPQRFGDLRRHLGVAATTLARLLRAMDQAELLHHDDRGRYAVSQALSELALDLLDQGGHVGAAVPAVAALARQTGASAAFWMVQGRRLVLLAKHEVADGFHYIDRFDHIAPESNVFGLAVLSASPHAPRRASVDAALRRLHATPDGVVVGRVAHDCGWRAVAPVMIDGLAVGSVGVSRFADASSAVVARDRRCVAAAARRLAGDLSAPS